MEVTAHTRLREEARVKRVLLQESTQRATHHVAGWIGRNAEKRSRIGAGIDDLVIKDNRRRGRDVQQNVVERRIVGDGIPSANDRRVSITKKHLTKSAVTHARRPRETQSRSEVVFIDRDLRESTLGQRYALEPERRGRIGLSSKADIVQRIDWLPGVFVTHTEFQGQILTKLPVILEEVELILLLVFDRRLTANQDDRSRRVGNQAGGSAESECAVDVRQKRDRVAEAPVIDTHDHRVFPTHPRKIVRKLSDAHGTPLRNVRRRTNCLKTNTSGTNSAQGDVGEGFVNQGRVWDATL